MNDYLYLDVYFKGFPDYISSECRFAYAQEFLEAREHFNRVSGVEEARKFLHNYKGINYIEYENFVRKQLRAVAKEMSKSKFSIYLAYSVSRDLVFLGHLKLPGIKTSIICKDDIVLCERK